MKMQLPNPYTITFTYLILGLAWIALTDKFIFSNFDTIVDYIFYENLKGYLFIILTSLVLLLLLRSRHKQIKEYIVALERTEGRYRKLYEESPQPMWVCSAGPNLIISMNDAALELLKYKWEDLDTLPFQKILHPKDHHLLMLYMQKARHGYERTGVWRFLKSNQQVVYLDVIIHHTFFEGEPAKMIIASNVTDLVKAEEEKLKIHNELYHYKKALDRSAMLSVTDINGTIIDVNNKFCEITKFNRNEVVGYTHRIVNSGYHPKSFFQELFETLEAGKVWRGEIRNRAKDGNIFWVDTSIVPVYDENNSIIKFMAISYPVTDRKMAEKRSEKIHNELVTFMYKASHNLKGPVATLQGLINIAKMDVNEPTGAYYINLLAERTNLLSYTLDELIAITKVKQEDLTILPIDFDKLVDNVLTGFEDKIIDFHIHICKKVNVETQFSSDEKLVTNMFFYLIDNAIKFRNNNNPKVEIKVEEVENGVMIKVADNGAGISDEIRSRIFDMYFRGNEKSKGSGLGLYIVSSIVERLCGYIKVQSKEDEGATFQIFIPTIFYMQKLMDEKKSMYLRNEVH